MLDYFSSKKTKTKEKEKEKEKDKKLDHRRPSEPLLTDDDEAFLRKITAQVEGTPPPLPERPLDIPIAGETEGNDAQLVLADEARRVPLPDVPDTPNDESTNSKELNSPADTTSAKDLPSPLSPTSPSKDGKKKRWSFLQFGKGRDRKATATGLDSAIADMKAAESKGVEPAVVPPGEAKKESDEIEQVLEQLNLAAINNRVFSFSDESRELLHKFTLVFKDLVNGAPTAYHDLEALLTNSEEQLQKMFKGLPPFVQQWVTKLPAKYTHFIGPEILAAAAADKPGSKSDLFSKGASAASKAGLKVKIPSLKDLVGKKGPLIGMFRTIISSLKTRFPALMSLNVIWSIAIAILLLVCWYCHKRGKETRLENERNVTEAEMEAIRAQVEADPPAEWNQSMITTAPEGASIEEVRAGLAPATSSTPARSSMEYAEGGSLAKAIKEEENNMARQKKDEAKL